MAGSNGCPRRSVAVYPLPQPLSCLPPSPFFLPCSIFGPKDIAMLTARISVVPQDQGRLLSSHGMSHRPSRASCSCSLGPSCATASTLTGSLAGPPPLSGVPSPTQQSLPRAPRAAQGCLCSALSLPLPEGRHKHVLVFMQCLEYEGSGGRLGPTERECSENRH